MPTKSPEAQRRAATLPKRRTLVLTAAYVPAVEGGYVVEVLEARGVHAQGDDFDDARRYLHSVIALMLEEAPHLRSARSPPRDAVCDD